MPADCEHVDAERLKTDLAYRFGYISDFMGFGDADVEAIHGAAGLLAPLVPTVVNAVYTKLFTYDVTTEPFALRNSDFTGEIVSSIEKIGHDTPQIKHRKDMLSAYLVKLVTAEYDEKFLAYLDHVGKIHTVKGKKKNVDGTFMSVDYVHVNALLAYVMDILISTIMGADLPVEAKTAAIRAFSKLLWIQNDFFARHYID